MLATVTKAELLNSVVLIRETLCHQHMEESAEVDKIIDACNSVSNDLTWFFKYTNDDETWSHVANLATTSPFSTFLSVDTVATENVSTFLYELAENYFSQDIVKVDLLDWFYLDFISAVHYRVLTKQYSDYDFKSSFPVIHAAIQKFDGDNYLALLSYGFFKLLKYAIGFFVLVVLFSLAAEGSLASGLFGASLILYKIYSLYSEVKRYHVLQTKSVVKLNRFQKFYDLFSSRTVRWDLVTEDIKNFRVLDIDFPLAIDTAITSRKI